MPYQGHSPLVIFHRPPVYSLFYRRLFLLLRITLIRKSMVFVRYTNLLFLYTNISTQIHKIIILNDGKESKFQTLFKLKDNIRIQRERGIIDIQNFLPDRLSGPDFLDDRNHLFMCGDDLGKFFGFRIH